MKKFAIAITLMLGLWTCSDYQILETIDEELKSRMRALSPSGDLAYYRLPSSQNLASIPQSGHNPLTHEKIELGKMLFFETGLANDPAYEAGRGTYSCATCHVPSAGFLPGRAQGIADGGFGFGIGGEQRSTFSDYDESELDVQGARPLSVLNTAFVTNSTWSGKFGANHANLGTESSWEQEEATRINHLGMDGLESQNIEGLALHRMQISPEIITELGYKPMFDQAFADFPESDRYSPMTASFALSAYLRSLLTNEAPFQKWLRGENKAMTERQKKGAMLFYGKAGCYRCHQGAAMSAVKFYALGVNDLYHRGDAFNTSAADKRNLGRGGFTGQEQDMYKFKVPQLYNLKNASFYFHGSSKNNLWGVVEYFNRGIPENDDVPIEQIATEFHPLNLTTIEIDALVSFLSDGLYDAEIDRYVPEKILSGNCFPNNDATSRSDLGCE